jgi:hypothetical protein
MRTEAARENNNAFVNRGRSLHSLLRLCFLVVQRLSLLASLCSFSRRRSSIDPSTLRFV